MKKNISMDVLMREQEEDDIALFNEFEPRKEEFMDEGTSGMKNLMKHVITEGNKMLSLRERHVRDEGGKKEHIQTTLDSFFVKSGVSCMTIEDAELRIQTLECENAVLKNEMQEMKEKMDRLESLLFHTSSSILSPSSADPVSQNLLYDKISTKVREIEKDIVNIKVSMESLEASNEDHEDRIEWLESHYEDDDSRVGKGEVSDYGF